MATSAEARGNTHTVDTVTEPCDGCGVVQQITVTLQRRDGQPGSTHTTGECEVCGNDHAKNPPVVGMGATPGEAADTPCPACGGAVHNDPEDGWTCKHCGRTLGRLFGGDK